MRSEQRATEATITHALWTVGPPPFSEAPGQVPSCTLWPCQRDIVDSRATPWVASKQPRQRHPATTPQPEAFDCFIAIHRAGGQMPTVVTDQRREAMAISPDQCSPGITWQSRETFANVQRIDRWIFHEQVATGLYARLRGSCAWNRTSQ